jgi:hypothetical protein
VEALYSAIAELDEDYDPKRIERIRQRITEDASEWRLTAPGRTLPYALHDLRGVMATIADE